MLFNKIKNKFYSKAKISLSSSGSKKSFGSSVPTVPASSRLNPLVTAVYRSCKKNVKTALANFDTFKHRYNPYQLKEQADDSVFDPYFLIDAQEVFYIPGDKDDGEYQEIDKIQEPVDKTEGMDSTDKTEDMNNNTNKTTDMYCDPFENTDTTVPISERLIPAATSTAGSVANNVLWGAMAAVHCVSNGKKTVDNYCKDYNKIRNAPLPPRDCYTLFDDRENDAAINDTPFLCDNNPDMVQVSEEEQKRRERKLAEREAIFKKIASYGGKHTRYPIDETWGFIESDYTVQFKTTLSSVQEPSMEAPTANHDSEEQPVIITSPTNEEENLGFSLI